MDENGDKRGTGTPSPTNKDVISECSAAATGDAMELIDISPGDGSAMFDLNLFIISSHFRATLYRHLGPAQRRDPSRDA